VRYFLKRREEYPRYVTPDFELFDPIEFAKETENARMPNARMLVFKNGLAS